jgi:hypothetical protein
MLELIIALVQLINFALKVVFNADFVYSGEENEEFLAVCSIRQ